MVTLYPSIVNSVALKSLLLLTVLIVTHVYLLLQISRY